MTPFLDCFLFVFVQYTDIFILNSQLNCCDERRHIEPNKVDFTWSSQQIDP